MQNIFRQTKFFTVCFNLLNHYIIDIILFKVVLSRFSEVKWVYFSFNLFISISTSLCKQYLFNMLTFNVDHQQCAHIPCIWFCLSPICILIIVARVLFYLFVCFFLFAILFFIDAWMTHKNYHIAHLFTLISVNAEFDNELKECL